jgi:hypothetical protein
LTFQANSLQYFSCPPPSDSPNGQAAGLVKPAIQIARERTIVAGKRFSYLNPKCEARRAGEKGGCGVFARQTIGKDEIVCVWGGRILTENELDPNIPDFNQRILQIDEALYLETPEALEPTDCFNHSCEPNLGFSGQVGLITMREIEAGEEVTFDYAMCDGTPYDEFKCFCGAANCRGKVSGDDWKRADLWVKYDGYFSPYLARRIAKLKTHQ